MTAPDFTPLYDVDDLLWCARCQRPESAGAVLHEGPYTAKNSHLLTPAAERTDAMGFRGVPATGRYGDTSPGKVCAELLSCNATAHGTRCARRLPDTGRGCLDGSAVTR
jgi:hypothetical protein